MAHLVRGRTGRWLAPLLAVAMLATACSGGGDDDGAADEPAPTTAAERDATGEVRPRLSTGDAPAEEPTPVPVVEGEVLAEDAVAAVLEALPDWSGGAADTEDYQRPAETLRPPRTGEVVDVEFPADDDAPPPTVPEGPLQVLRFQPEGDVPIAAAVNITFDQPMVPLITLGQLAAEDVPATITPELAGTWQWIGTRTLRFEHDSDLIDRLPMATTYTVTVPAGTTSETGGELAEDLTFSFTTPPVRAVQVTPLHESLPLDQVFVATFDQRIDREAMLDAVHLTADGDDRAIRLATDDEVAADEDVAARVEQAPEGRWLAFRAEDELPRDAAIDIVVGPDAPSAEGPGTDPGTQDFEGRTYAPLAVDDHSCDQGDRCTPGRPLTVWFNNPLDPDAFDPDLVSVSPELRGAFVTFQPDRGIQISGDTVAETTYAVTIDGGLRDVFGQELGDDETVELRVVAPRPELVQPNQELITLDPFAEVPTLPVVVIDHDELRVRAYRVDPGSDWDDFAEAADRYRYPDERGAPSLPAWPLVLDETVATDATAHERSEVPIDLSAALPAGVGQLVVLVEPTGALAQLDRDDDDYWSNRPIVVWVQATDLALDALVDQDELRAWATDVRTGAPVDGVSVALAPTGTPGTTDEDGLATLPLTTLDQDRGRQLLVGRRGDDVVLTATWGAWQRADGDDALWYVFDDRGTYRPGETVSVKGWVRRRTAGDGQLELYGPDTKVSWTLWDEAGAQLDEGTVEGTALGGFDLEAAIPAGANLGTGRLGLTLHHPDGATGFDHAVAIQDFRRPQFEVTTEVESPLPSLIDQAAQVSVTAAYYSGGGLPDAPVGWTVRSRETTYAPPGWSDFSFGRWHPWWIADDVYGPVGRGGFGFDELGPSPCFDCPGFEETIETYEATTDASGRHVLRIDLDGDVEGQPTSVVAEATVTDVDRQAWSARSDLLVHPATVYVGLRSTRPFVEPGEEIVVEAIAVDPDGEVVAGAPITIEASRTESQWVDGEWTDVAVSTETCEVDAAEEAVECRFATDAGGRYEIAATVTDDGGRTSLSELSVWVSGGRRPTARRVELEQVELIPDAEEHAPGDTASLLVVSPFTTAHGLLTVARDGVVSTSTFEVVDGTATVEVPLRERDVPNVHVQVDLAGATVRLDDAGEPVPEAGDRPAYATGRVVLAVSTEARELQVAATPRDDELEPGGSTTIDVSVQDHDGAPVDGAEVALVVVDEAVLALSAYDLGDPLAAFYAALPAELQTTYGRESLLLVDPQALVEQNATVPTTTSPAMAPGALPLTDGPADFDMVGNELSAAAADDGAEERAGAGGDAAAVDVRTDFGALALFEPDVVTGADGTATVELDLPDSLTRYRVMAVAVDGAERAGSGEDSITARLPLMVRPSPPRFLSFGDAFELPVVVQNQTDDDLEVDVVLEAGNLALVGPDGKRVTVPANDRVEVRFDAETESAGTAGYRAVAVGGGFGDAAQGELPVHTPATSEAFATYGVVDDGAIVQPLVAPTDVFPQFGGLEVGTSSTAVAALTDAVLYLHDYDYESADAYAGRILTVAALRDVLEAFDAKGLPPAAELTASVDDDLAELVRLQQPSGGFLGWRGARAVFPFTSIQAVQALVVADDRGYAVPSQALARGLDYLRNVEDHIPADYGEATKRTLRAYALHVRDLAGDRDPAKAIALHREAGDELELDALAWLLPVLDDEAARAEILRTFANRATETAGAANFATDYGDDEYLVLASDRRTDGIVLDALIRVAPDDDLLPKVVAGLLGNQTQGRWGNVQENTFILLALHRYFTTFESVTPDFVARVWLGDQYAGEHEYRGRTTAQGRTIVPMADLVDGGDADLIVQKDGGGRLYYRLGLRYAPTDLDLDPLDRGFVVTRTYEGVDDPDDVTRDDDGTWHVKPGATVRVRLAMVADSRRTHVVLLDPYAAGLEPLNPELAVTATPLPPDDEEPPYPMPFEGDVMSSRAMVDAPFPYVPWGRWYERDSLRDDRAEAYTSLLGGGVYEYTYLARATTPGRFIAPPARAEEVYAPETFGRSSTDVVVVEG